MQVTDKLIEDVKNGSISAFEEIYRLFYGKVKRFAGVYLVNINDVEDVVQNVFLTLWEKREFIRSDGKFSNFLLVITKNQCISKLREYKIRNSFSKMHTEQYQLTLLNIYALKQLQEDKLIRFDLDKIIRDAISALPDDCRKIFIQSKLDGLKYKEIADLLHISEKTVEKKMTISLKALRKVLKEKLIFLLF